MEEMQKVAKEVSEKGSTPYVIPVGGSNPTGAMGYVACAQEIMAQSFEQGIDFSTVVCVSGSAGYACWFNYWFFWNAKPDSCNRN